MFTFQRSSSPAFSSISFATPSGIVVLSDGELGLEIVIFEVNSAMLLVFFTSISIYLRIGNGFIYARMLYVGRHIAYNQQTTAERTSTI